MNDKSKFTGLQGIIGACALIVVLLVGGCGDFFEKKSIEVQTREILNELEQVKENPNVGNPLPDMYRGPAQRIKTSNGVKLFYFTRQHAVDNLAALVDQQFVKVKTDKGNKSYSPYYTVSKNPATNQLIIDCPGDEEADKVLEFLEMVDVPPIQVNIDCLILERFADVTMDWETTILIENFFGEEVTLGKSKFPEPAFPGSALRESKRREFGLDFGFWRNKDVTGHQFRAVVDMLISRGYLKILMNPTIETVNGQKAKITSRENVGLDKWVSGKGFDSPYLMTEYQWVEDTLEVTPHVFADGSIGLETKVQIGSKSKPEGVVQVSIITEREINVAENRIKPGDSLIIGGIRKSEKRAVIRGIPFFKDLPIIGVLFSSKDYEEKATEVIFILTPSISSGGVKHTEMVKEIREKHATPKYKTGLEEALTDPFGISSYTEQIEQQAAEAEFKKLKAEIEKAQALQEVDQIKEKLLETAELILAEKSRTAKARTEALKAKKQAEKSKREAEKARAEAEKVKVKAEKAKAQVEKARADAKKIKEKAEKTKKEVEQAEPGKGKDNKENK